MSDPALVPDSTNTPPPVEADLAGGLLRPPDLALTNLGLEESRHRITLQKTVASSALAFAAVLFMAAMVFAGALIYVMVQSGGDQIHWHASILVAAFVVPPTILVVALLRAAYRAKDGADQKESDSPPTVSFIKECLSTVKELWPRKGD